MTDLFGETPRPATAGPVSVRDMVACLGREVRMRESAYPKWVQAGRMSAAEASGELSRMRAALNLVAAIEAPSPALLEALGEALDPLQDVADTFRPDRVRGVLAALVEGAR